MIAPTCPHVGVFFLKPVFRKHRSKTAKTALIDKIKAATKKKTHRPWRDKSSFAFYIDDFGEDEAESPPAEFGQQPAAGIRRPVRGPRLPAAG